MNDNQSTSHTIEILALRTIREHHMLAGEDRILIGVSGGPDSIALVRVLITLKEALGLSLGLAHMNHGLRGDESSRDENFVRDFAGDLGIPLSVESRDIKSFAKDNRLSLEEAGRNARYEFFNRIAEAEGYTRIALGHNRDDHVEQVLMSLIRGSGARGLRGIAPVRGGIIRPLIRVSKEDILDYLKETGQSFVMDSSNEDSAFLRNRVRHSLIPLLEKEFNPDIKTGLERLSHILSLEDDFMSDHTGQAYDAIRSDQTHDDQAQEILSIRGLMDLHPALAGRVLRKGLLKVKGDLRRITHTHIRDIVTLIKASESNKSLDLPGQIRVYKKKRLLYIKKEALPLRKLGRQQKSDKLTDRLKSRDNSGVKT